MRTKKAKSETSSSDTSSLTSLSSAKNVEPEDSAPKNTDTAPYNTTDTKEGTKDPVPKKKFEQDLEHIGNNYREEIVNLLKTVKKGLARRRKSARHAALGKPKLKTDNSLDKELPSVQEIINRVYPEVRDIKYTLSGTKIPQEEEFNRKRPASRDLETRIVKKRDPGN